MARLARKQLADQRAMEEESLRLTLHGKGNYVGRGATPSMGLSQFRGGRTLRMNERQQTRNPRSELAITTPRRQMRGRGTPIDFNDPESVRATIRLMDKMQEDDAKRDKRRKAKERIAERRRRRRGGAACGCEDDCDCSSSEDEDMKGGRSLLSRLPGMGLSRGRPVIRAPTLPSLSALTRPTVRPYTNLATPSFPRPNIHPGRQFVGPRLVRAPRAVTSAVSKLGLPPGRRPGTVFNATNARRVAALLAAGVPIAMLGAYLGDMGGDDGGGFYDDYAGDGGDGGVPTVPPTTVPPTTVPPITTIIDTDGDGIPDEIDPDDDNDGIPDESEYGVGGELPEDIADQLSRSELAFYLQSGNLPTRFYQQAKRGRGRATKRKPSARNEIVKQVMRERGVSLPQASRIVKEEGLYRK